MASAHVASWNQSGGILIPGSAAGTASAAARRSRPRARLTRSLALPGPLTLARPLRRPLGLPASPPGLRRGRLRLRPPAAGPLVLPGARARGLPGRGHQPWPSIVLIVGEVQTLDGWLFVVLQIVAVIMLAAPSAPLAIALDGSWSAAATWAQVWPERICGLYWAPCTKYLPPKSMNGMAPASAEARTAGCRTW